MRIIGIDPAPKRLGQRIALRAVCAVTALGHCRFDVQS